MRTVCIVLILAVSIIQVHSRSSGGGITPTTSNDPGFNFKYFFLWHSDATILNYLRGQNGAGIGGGDQVDVMTLGDSSNTQGLNNFDERISLGASDTKQDSNGTGGGDNGHGHGHGAEDNASDFQNLGRLFEVLGQDNSISSSSSNGGGSHGHGHGGHEEEANNFRNLERLRGVLGV
ncbi:unnamed protein product [Meganyctiphanes norvegica]|uniref:Uncharacterized protein n=1 Tax=Meganyctiphanes norvegica TaxID=48144 RepID=A0AAV2RCR8_MEGNR